MIYSGVFVILLVLAAPATFAKKNNKATDEKTREVLDVGFYGLDGDNAVEVSTEDGQDSATGTNNREIPEPVDLPPSRDRGQGRRGVYHGYHHRGRGMHHGGPDGYGPMHGYHHGGRHGRGNGHGMGYIHGPHHMRWGGGGPWWMQSNVTAEEQMTYMCERLRSWPGNNGRMTWMMRVHRIDNATRTSMLSIWNRRRNDMINCCARDTTDSKLECVREFQGRRFNRVCSGEEPICPWALIRGAQNGRGNGRADGQPTLTTRCCEKEGSERTQCFVDGMRDYRMNNGGGWGMRGINGRRGRRPLSAEEK